MRTIIVVLLFCMSISLYGQIDTITWQKLNPFPEPSLSVAQFGYFLIDSDFYVAGGWIGVPGNIFSNEVWRYHIPTDGWHQMGNLPFGGAATSCTFVLNGKGYFLTSTDSVSNLNCDNMFWEYNPAGDSWTRRMGFPDVPRQNSSSFVYGGKGYVGQTYGCATADSHFWQYDPILDQWSQIATLPADAYVLGGYDIGGNFLKDIWRYGITTNHWDSIGLMPGAARAYPVLWGFDSVLICGGGEDGTYLYNDYYRYDIINNLWTSIVFQNFPDSVVYSTTFIYNKRAYYFGGPTDLLYASYNMGMWSFDASKYIHDTTTGINEVKNDVEFSVYPNPTNRDKDFSISTSESGGILFYDALGRVLDERKLTRGINQIKLTTDNEVIFYRATLQYGTTENGKVVFIK